MSTPEAPRTPGKWVTYRIEDGKRFERWPIDAKDMLASGLFTREVPGTGVAGPQPVHPGLDPKSITPPGLDPVPHVTAAESALDSSPHKLMQNQAQEAPEAPGVEKSTPESKEALTEPPTPLEQVVEVKAELLEWTMPSYTPERYLERWPQGPQADLARAVIAQLK